MWVGEVARFKACCSQLFVHFWNVIKVVLPFQVELEAAQIWSCNYQTCLMKLLLFCLLSQDFTFFVEIFFLFLVEKNKKKKTCQDSMLKVLAIVIYFP